MAAYSGYRRGRPADDHARCVLAVPADIFTAKTSAGIRPRSNYLKVIGDFCRWNERIVFGCDDTAKNEFLNKRKAKGEIAAPQSQSNLWFVEPDQLDQLGPVIGRGGVWLLEDVPANSISDPFLGGGFDRRGLHLAHGGKEAVTIVLEIDETGNGTWKKSREIVVPAGGYVWTEIKENAAWIRLYSPAPLTRAIAWFNSTNRDARSDRSDKLFDGLARAGDLRITGGLVRARAENKRTLSMAAMGPGANGPGQVGYYELGCGFEAPKGERQGGTRLHVERDAHADGEPDGGCWLRDLHFGRRQALAATQRGPRV